MLMCLVHTASHLGHRCCEYAHFMDEGIKAREVELLASGCTACVGQAAPLGQARAHLPMQAVSILGWSELALPHTNSWKGWLASPPCEQGLSWAWHRVGTQ